jgi:hypothetical protein
MKLSKEQIELLKMIYSRKNAYIGSPKYLAMDDDGDLKYFAGRAPERDEEGFWGDGNTSIDLGNCNEEEMKILSFVKLGHEFPYDIKKMIETGKIEEAK